MSEIAKITDFLRTTFQHAGKKIGVVAVSGGIDSTVSLTLLCQALGAQHVHPVLLPYGTQDTIDAETIVTWNAIPKANQHVVNIKETVDQIASTLYMLKSDNVRLGNVMARMRMIAVYDFAKQQDALVCGTENKSEKYLGYFTRFGDGASDIEPIEHLYKTEVRQLATELRIPEIFLSKAPTAGLWENQTDEQELGFSYKDADQVLYQYIDLNKNPSDISVKGVPKETVAAIIARVDAQRFKLEVPYHLS